jgi:hypothetical protein
MFCTTCGNPITVNQAVCSKCGRPTSVGMMQGGGNRVSQHYRTVGILQIIYSGLHVPAGIGAVLVARFVLGGALGMADPRPPMFVQPLVEVVGWVLACVSAIGLVGGIGILSRAPWARSVTLVAGFIELINMPFGTALGIYTIWVLLSSGSEEEYRRLSFAHS